MIDDKGLRGRVTRSGEEALGKVAQELLDNPVVTRAMTAAFETRERATRAQELAMAALNLPSASDLERLTRRVRSVSQRLEGIEDAVDRLEQRIASAASSTPLEQRLTAIEEVLARIERSLGDGAAPASAPAASARARAPRARSSARAGQARPSSARPRATPPG
jgi:hypothetical protein